MNNAELKNQDREALKSLATRFIGRKVRILPGHPHEDRIGVVDGLRHTWAGWGFEVKFAEGDGCFVFEGKDWMVIG